MWDGGFRGRGDGVRVVAFEPVLENLQRICDGVFLNRAGDRVTVYAAAASDRIGNITFHKLVGRLDNSAISATGAKLAFKSNEEIAIEVPTIPLDEVIPDSERVLLIKIDVQGWEYHVLRGASRLLSRRKPEAPYLIYEEDERLLQASNSSSQEIRTFLQMLGTAIVQSTVTMRTAQRISLQTAFGGNLTSSLFFLEFFAEKLSEMLSPHLPLKKPQLSATVSSPESSVDVWDNFGYDDECQLVGVLEQPG
uniref:Methyltransferase FkbM domain-containing protein n=1 Tax=Ananas comosus var. bracteatus TaxID=296719 RepID=A0A6V7PEN5_ANACO|nr:unnamed protein product [Ananas comosus var. bracteatus]